MSIFQYVRDPNDTGCADVRPDSVRAHAVDHRHGAYDPATGKYGPAPCGHQPGWPDTSLQELPPECVAAGCSLGYMVELFRGRVLSTGEYNGRDDSDFYADVANDDGSTRRIVYATTRGWSYFDSAHPDASDELRARVEEVNRRRAAEARAAAERERAELDAKTPSVGKLVRVKSKRSKIPAGTVGRVVWFGESNYTAPQHRSRYANPYAGLVDPNHRHPGRDLRAYRVGIQVDGRRLFASATCFEVVPEEATQE